LAALAGAAMAEFRWLSEAQMRRIAPYFPLSHGIPQAEELVWQN
jgi:hypothetical protein